MLSAEDTVKLKEYIQSKETQCEKFKLSSNFSSVLGEKFCEYFFDGILCWPATKAGNEAQMRCPYDFVKSEYYEEFAVRKCNSDGQWYINQTTQSRWADYGACGKLYIESYLKLPEIDSLVNSTIYQVGVPIIKEITHFGYGLSIVTLICSLLIFALFKKLRCARNRLHIHLFVTFLMRALMSCLKDALFVNGVTMASDVLYENGKPVGYRVEGSWICKAFTSLRHYFILANFMMVLMEGLYLYNLIFLNSFSGNGRVAVYYALGWGLPLSFIVPWIILRIYFENEYCWTRTNTYLSILIDIPIWLSISINFILFLVLVRILCIKISSIQQRKRRYKKLTKATLVMVTLFGVPYILSSILYMYSSQPIPDLAWLFFDQTFTSFQGFFAALIYCITNNEVRMELQLKYKVIWIRKSCNKRQRTISNTQQISIPMQEDVGDRVMQLERERATYI